MKYAWYIVAFFPLFRTRRWNFPISKPWNKTPRSHLLGPRKQRLGEQVEIRMNIVLACSEIVEHQVVTCVFLSFCFDIHLNYIDLGWLRYLFIGYVSPIIRWPSDTLMTVTPRDPITWPSGPLTGSPLTWSTNGYGKQVWLISFAREKMHLEVDLHM